MNTGGGQGHR